MSRRTGFSHFAGLYLVLSFCMGGVAVGKENAPAPVVPLTEAGKALEARYAKEMSDLKARLRQALPQMNEQERADYLQLRETEKEVEAEMKAAQDGLDKIRSARAHLGLAENRHVPAAEKMVADTQAKLKAAETEDERAALQEQLAKEEEGLRKALENLKNRKAELAELEPGEPGLVRQWDAAQEEYAQVKGRTMAAMRKLGVEDVLASDTLDTELARYVVLAQATPGGLAAFAQQGKEQEQLVENLLADGPLMVQMLMADGAQAPKVGRKEYGPAQYGPAMKIYTDIRKASARASKGMLQRLALAISLEHAVPVSQQNPEALTNAPETIDPVKRYLHYEQAYLAGDLDPGFDAHDVWSLRMVVNGNEPDDALAWGRQMLRNYRPDHVATPDYKWRYVAAVKTEIRYGSQDVKFDQPELQYFQNILMNGGVCGRRAFFGRFILRAFGVPTTARPQPGHAALTHWTPEGWVVCLGAGWGVGSTHTRYGKDLDFLASTQARVHEKAFKKVKRAQWIGDVMGEQPYYGFHAGDAGFWYLVALQTQRDIIDQAKAVALAAVGTDIGEANEPVEKDQVDAVTIRDQDRKISITGQGVITLPAAACSRPTNSTDRILFMPSNLGGMQLHYTRLGERWPETFEYTFDVPDAGRYALTARVVTPSWKQHLSLSVNGATELVDIALPFTVGLWGQTDAVEIALVKGRNVLTFSREHEGLKGVTIRDFTLTPLED